MTKEQIKEETSKFPKATFSKDYEGYILIPSNSLNSLIEKAYEEGKKEGIKEEWEAEK